MQRIKLDDEVIIISGKSKGHRGKVTKIIRDENSKLAKVIVDGGNMIKKHVKPDPNRNIQGGIVEKEAAIHESNVAIFNPITSKADKVGIKTLEDGKKVRYFKSNGELVDIK